MGPINRRRAVALALAAVGQGAAAQQDARPLRIVVPFAAGSAPDVVARAIADPVAASLDTPVNVENMPGGGGIIGVAHVARAASDGRTVVLSGDAALVMPDPQGVRRYDPVRDLAPISRLVATPNVLVVGREIEVQDVAQLLEWLRAQPRGRVSYASAGNGTSSHRAAELLASMAGVEMVHVPSSQSPLPDVIGGRVQLFFANVATALPLARQGKLRALAVSSLRRTSVAPELPTLAESGLPGFESVAWFGLLAPSGTPGEMLARWQRAARDAVAGGAVKAQLQSLGIEAVGGSADELRETIERETRKWAGFSR